jgi:hypothetical protein
MTTSDANHNELVLEEQLRAEEVLKRLSPQDTANVFSVISATDDVAREYFSSGEAIANRMRFISQESLERINAERRPGTVDDFDGYPFFAVYAIGGNVTKEGDRPDLDLMLVSNAWWSSGSFRFEHHPLLTDVTQRLNIGQVEIAGEMPCRYNVGITGGKGKAIIKQPINGGKSIDITYVRSIEMIRDPSDERGEFDDALKYDPKKRLDRVFVSEEQFNIKDVDASGNPLPKVILYRAKMDIRPVLESFVHKKNY